MKILLIEDDKETAKTLKEQLDGFFIVELSFTGKEGEYLAQVNEYDLIILDLILPDISGLKVCKILRENGIDIPILMLTGQFETDTKVIALDSGADDYLVKPFNFEELLARTRALLRRPKQSLQTNIITIGDLKIDLSKIKVTRSDKIINLRPKEFYLLEYLARNAGRVVTRNMILEHVWESANELETNAIDVHIKYLRDVLDKPFNKKLIKTVHGLGYKIET